MLEFILSLLVVFAAPLPAWLIVLHLVPTKYKRIAYYSSPILWVITGLIVYLHNPFSSKIITGPEMYIPGLIVLGAAIMIDWRVMTSLGLRRIACLDEVDNKKSGLITEGVYKYSRHPRYVEYALISLGFGLVYGYTFLIWFSFYLLAGFYLNTFFEENELVERFGDEYKTYQKKTKKFFIF